MKRDKVDGACWDCNGDTRPGRSRCDACQAAARDYQRRRYYARTAGTTPPRIQLDLPGIR